MDATIDSDALLRTVIEAANLGYDVLGVSGGEPLLYPGLVELLTMAKTLGMTTTVTSNGMLLTQRRLDQLAGLVDVIALSLDGTPETHDRMRGDTRAFRMLDRRMAAIRASGIQFGFICTLTYHNVQELTFVAEYAAANGASMLQVHPLEPDGAAIVNLPDSVPDEREMIFAYLESARLTEAVGIPVQLDLTSSTDLRRHPDRFLSIAPAVGQPLAQWLTPLVLETDGTASPVTYGFPRRYALGNVRDSALSDLALTWDPEPLRALSADTRSALLGSGRRLFNWYDEISRAAHHTTKRQPSMARSAH